MNKMTPSQTAKQLGCESLAQVERISGVSKRTLINWYKNKPQLFAVVCVGVAAGQTTCAADVCYKRCVDDLQEQNK